MARQPHISSRSPKAGTVTITMMPRVLCALCNKTLVVPPRQTASDVLTGHFVQEHKA